MTKNCVIIHGCSSNKESAMNFSTRTYDKHWIPWTRKSLAALGISTTTPLMPESWAPVYEKFKKEFEKQKVTKNTILIGHSCGCAFLVRWLGDTKKKIDTLILVAPWKIAGGDAKRKSIFKPFYEFDIDKTIKDRVKRIVMFTANDEYERGKESLKIYKRALGGKIIELKNHGHYIFDHMKTDEFPELIEQIVKFDSRKALLVPMNRDNKVFIQDRRGYKKPDWGYFGGGIEKNETPLAAVIREAKEELDIDIKERELTYLGTVTNAVDDVKIIRHMFLYPTKQKEFNVLEGRGGQWLTFSEAREKLGRPDQFDEIVRRVKAFI